MSMPRPKDDRTSWTQVGQDVEDAGLWASIIPAATEGPSGKAFWFQKYPGQRDVNRPLANELAGIREVFIVHYSSDDNPMTFTWVNRGRKYRFVGKTPEQRRAQLHRFMRKYGRPKR